MTRLLALLLAGAVCLAAVACGSSQATPSTATPSTATPSGSPAAGASGDSGMSGGAAPGGGAAPSGAASATGSLSADGADAWARIPEIVAEAQPRVVSIQREGGEGSGVIWDAEGIIVTNHHVIEGATEVVVAFADGTRDAGRVLASDPLSDLAIVRTERTGLPAAEFNMELPPIGSLALAL